MSSVSRFIYMPARCNLYVHYILDFRNPNRQPPVSINVFKYRKQPPTLICLALVIGPSIYCST